MEDGRTHVKAGQIIRILDIPVQREHGCFDALHGHPNGRSLADSLRTAANKKYGVAGRAFLEALTADERDLRDMLAEIRALDAFQADGNQAGRAAARFAVIAMAGELATEYGVVPWPEGTATVAAAEAFRVWREWQGKGDDEPRRIIQAVRDFIDAHGDSRFSETHRRKDDPSILSSEPSDRIVYNRAGWWKPGKEGQRIFCFLRVGLQEATKGFDVKTVIDVLINCGALLPGLTQTSKLTRISDGSTTLTVRTFQIRDDKLSAEPDHEHATELKKLATAKGVATKKGKLGKDELVDDL